MQVGAILRTKTSLLVELLLSSTPRETEIVKGTWDSLTKTACVGILELLVGTYGGLGANTTGDSIISLYFYYLLSKLFRKNG